jgi:hypothetical protein
VGTLALLGYLGTRGHARLPLHFALWGALGGAIGFGGGGLWMVVGKKFPAGKNWFSWWKFMEFTFGSCLGLTLGYAAWLKREFIRSIQSASGNPSGRPAIMASLVVTTLLALAVLWVEAYVDVVCAFTFVGVVFLLVALFWESFALQMALVITSVAFVYDLVEKTIEETGRGGADVKWYIAAVTALVLSFLVARRQRSKKPTVLWALLMVMWLGVVVSYIKSWNSVFPLNSHSIVELIFTLSAVALTWLLLKWLERDSLPLRANASSAPQ